VREEPLLLKKKGGVEKTGLNGSRESPGGKTLSDNRDPEKPTKKKWTTEKTPFRGKHVLSA